MASIYLVASLRNPVIPSVANLLRSAGHTVFDDWYAGGPDADDAWKRYEGIRNRTYAEAIVGAHATNVFEFDMRHIKDADTGILILPAGRSAHLELGLMIGRGQRGYVLFDEEPAVDRWDLMYKIANGIFFDIDELMKVL